ncbi:hypothetical protein GGX14DRAFT_386229 [Mycena pura]|uniref:Uncharacterized protein n=1 Tax=Mycena pura TaxID=153505 RepID=A0AAD6YPI2_9AGAR|nr:hypothetical protein GGX14DRAFT_386229 [Mycena pura]
MSSGTGSNLLILFRSAFSQFFVNGSGLLFTSSLLTDEASSASIRAVLFNVCARKDSVECKVEEEFELRWWWTSTRDTRNEVRSKGLTCCIAVEFKAEEEFELR